MEGRQMKDIFCSRTAVDTALLLAVNPNATSESKSSAAFAVTGLEVEREAPGRPVAEIDP